MRLNEPIYLGKLQVAYDSVSIARSASEITSFESLSGLQTRHGLYRKFGKRCFDVALVLMAIVPIVTVVLIMALIIMFDGGAPFYSQNRVGKNGRIFRMFKLRSMVRDADQVLAAYLAANPKAKAEWDLNQKLRHDPRITRFGALIRATSLDELPQMFNVLKGDMSLVGPRPMMAEQRRLYPGTEYYLMRPGITGFWQVSVRNESSFSQRASFDRAYFVELSAKTDIEIIARTVGVVLRATGR